MNANVCIMKPQRCRPLQDTSVLNHSPSRKRWASEALIERWNDAPGEDAVRVAPQNQRLALDRALSQVARGADVVSVSEGHINVRIPP